jgi:hypothetical protein
VADVESDRLESPGKQAPAPEPSSDKSDLRAGRDQDLDLSTSGLATGETQRKRIALDDDAFRAAASTEAGSAAPVDVFSEIAVAPTTKTEDEALRTERGKRSAVAAKESRPVVVELPAGLIERGQLLSVERVEEWIALLAGPHGEAIEMLGPPAADRRLVLIGPRNGLACDALTVSGERHTERIEWTYSPKEREAGGGCALVLPLDGRTVSIAGPQ